MQIKYPWGKSLVFMNIEITNDFATRKAVVDLATERYPVVFEKLKAFMERPDHPFANRMYHPTTTEAVYWAWYDVHNMGRDKKRHPSLKETRHIRLLDMLPHSKLRYMVHEVNGPVRCGALYLAVFDEYMKYHTIRRLWSTMRRMKITMHLPIPYTRCDFCGERFEVNEGQYSHGHPDERLHKRCLTLLQGLQEDHERLLKKYGETLGKPEKTPEPETSADFEHVSTTLH